MSNSLLQKSLHHLTCSQLGHEYQPLNYVCIDKGCEKNSLVCYLCGLQQHQGHDKLILKVFLNQILSIQKNSNKTLPLTATLDSTLQKIHTKLIQYDSFYDNKSLIYRTFDTFRQITVNQAINFYKIIDRLNQILEAQGKEKIIQKLNQFIKEYYFKYFAELQADSWLKLDIIEYLLKSKVQQLCTILTDLQKLKSSHKLIDSEVLNLFPLAKQVHKKIKVFFSQDMKPPNMQLLSPTQARVKSSGGQRLLILEPCLSKSSTTKKWAVKITKLASWIGVGVCHINAIKNADYNFNYSNTGHGSYLISSNGYSWSSYKKQYNSKFQPFTYATGDIIHIEYVPKQHLVKFRKESTEQTYELQIESNEDPIHPQINITGVNDQVEIINY